MSHARELGGRLTREISERLCRPAPVSEVAAAQYDTCMYLALSSTGHQRLYGLLLPDLDEELGRLDTVTLQAIGRHMVMQARQRGLQEPAYTKFHCLALCLADHLGQRGAALP